MTSAATSTNERNAEHLKDVRPHETCFEVCASLEIPNGNLDGTSETLFYKIPKVLAGTDDEQTLKIKVIEATSGIVHTLIAREMFRPEDKVTYQIKVETRNQCQEVDIWTAKFETNGQGGYCLYPPEKAA